MARKTRLIEAPRAGTVQLGQHTSMRFLAGSMGASPLPGNDEPLVQEKFEAPVGDDAAWEQQVRMRELAEGMASATFTPERHPTEFDGLIERRHLAIDFTHGGTRDPGLPMPSQLPSDLSGLPTTFTLEIEQKPDGTWKVTAPGVHVGLFVADRDLGAALSRAPGVLAEIVRLDGVVAKPKTRRAKA